jgi:hypothetical protein
MFCHVNLREDQVTFGATWTEDIPQSEVHFDSVPGLSASGGAVG